MSSVFLGTENWSWSAAIQNKIKGWETEAMKRLFRFKRKKKRRHSRDMLHENGDDSKIDLGK